MYYILKFIVEDLDGILQYTRCYDSFEQLMIAYDKLCKDDDDIISIECYIVKELEKFYTK